MQYDNIEELNFDSDEMKINNMQYDHIEELNFDYEIIPVINNFFTRTSDFSKIATQGAGFDISFLCEDEIRNEKHKFTLSIEIENYGNGKSRIKRTKITLLDEGIGINELDLRAYIESLYYRILISRDGRCKKNYVVRIYSKIYNSYPIKGEFLINYNYKTLLKPAKSKSREEPCTEHIVFFDVSLEAINIEHARTLAIAHVSDLQSFLSVLLDIGFEFVDSEFRTFVFCEKIEMGVQVSTQRYRTGYFDEELKLFVRDNLNYLYHIDDMGDKGGFFHGKVSMQLENEEKSNQECFYFDASDNKNIEQVFTNREIRKPISVDEAVYKDGISKDFHAQNQDIQMPREIRKYFRGVLMLPPGKKAAFYSCSRMYNLALKLHKSEPTACVSYLVCAVESLAKSERISFSEFIGKYSSGEYNKNLSDHYYGIRSSHFHSGKFYFHEHNPSLMTETDVLFYKRKIEFMEFYKTIRGCIVNWVEREILKQI